MNGSYLICHKCLKSFVLIFNVMQVLSVQKNNSEIGRLSSSHDIVCSVVATTAAESSILGTVTDFIGSSLDFPITKEHLVLPLQSVNLR